MNATIGHPDFNAAEFNENGITSTDRYVLFLNPDTQMLPVSEGDGHVIPPGVLYPGYDYLVLLISGTCNISMRFTTPMSPDYDGLGG